MPGFSVLFRSTLHALTPAVAALTCWLLVITIVPPREASANLLAQSPATPPADNLSQADLEEMLGPIALYPDNLLASVLAASVYPDEITAADQYIKGGGAVDGIDQQTWEDPVKAIAKIPEVLDFLTDNIEWTTAVGEVYIAQSQDVMAAVQSLRAKAKATGALQSSEQMTVVESAPTTAGAPQTIIIESPEPEVVYVPQYNPQTVYVDDDDDELAAGIIGFGIGITTGAILANNCDWYGGCVGWGGGGYHGDIDIERNTNIETGDINIGSGNTVTGGDRTRTTERGDRTNVQGGDRTTNNVGREGQKWQPNQQKVSERQAKSGGQRASDQFKGASNKSSAARSKVPTKTSASKTRQPSKPLKANNGKPEVKQAGNRSGDRAGAGNAGGGDRAGNAGRNTPKPATKTPPSRPAPKANSAPKARPKTPSSAPKPKANKSSGFSPSGGSSKASSRGASSRSGGGGSRSGGGGSRGGGGGGGRGGGGRR